MTNQEIIDSGATGAYTASTFTQGVATTPCWSIAFRAGTVSTSVWAKPACIKTVEAFIDKHGGTPRRVAALPTP